MAQLTIVIPDEHVRAVSRELVRAHAECVAAVQEALEHYSGSRTRLDDVQGALVELGDLHAALEQLRVPAARPAGGAPLTAHPELLADVVAAAAAAARGTPAERGLADLLRRVEDGDDR